MIDSKLENSIKEMNDPIEYQFTEKQLHILSSISKAEAAFNSQ